MKTTIIILDVIWALAIIPAGIVWMMSAMLFDAPGSERNMSAWIFSYLLLAFPFIAIIAIGSSWWSYKHHHEQMALFLSLLPVVLIMAQVVTFILMGSHDKSVSAEYAANNEVAPMKYSQEKTKALEITQSELQKHYPDQMRAGEPLQLSSLMMVEGDPTRWRAIYEAASGKKTSVYIEVDIEKGEVKKYIDEW